MKRTILPSLVLVAAALCSCGGGKQIKSGYPIEPVPFTEVKVNDGALTLIPYYAWNHRGAGNMEVWFKTAE